MIDERQKEKKNKRIALFTSLGIHAAILLLFFFLVAWRAPNPPLPEYGIELNFGLDDQGSRLRWPVRACKCWVAPIRRASWRRT